MFSGAMIIALLIINHRQILLYQISSGDYRNIPLGCAENADVPYIHVL